MKNILRIFCFVNLAMLITGFGTIHAMDIKTTKVDIDLLLVKYSREIDGKKSKNQSQQTDMSIDFSVNSNDTAIDLKKNVANFIKEFSPEFELDKLTLFASYKHKKMSSAKTKIEGEKGTKINDGFRKLFPKATDGPDEFSLMIEQCILQHAPNVSEEIQNDQLLFEHIQNPEFSNFLITVFKNECM